MQDGRVSRSPVLQHGVEMTSFSTTYEAELGKQSVEEDYHAPWLG